MLNPKLFTKEQESIPTRFGYGDALIYLAKINPDIFVLTADLAESTRVQKFKELFPDRFIDCGVAEQNLASVAAGLALEGKIPFLSSYAVFSPGRNWDQIRVSIAYNQANVKIAGAHTGVSVGPDGATHQGLEDIALMRVLPNMTVIAPCDYWQTYQATIQAANIDGPVYIRFAREKTPVITTSKTSFKVGKADVYKKGKDITIIASGPIVYEALKAADTLTKYGIETEVINNHTIKPLDQKTILTSAKKTGAIVSCEQHQISAGAGSAIAELVATNFPVPIEFVGMNNCFGQSGAPLELEQFYKMDSKAIVAACKKVIRRKHLTPNTY